MAQKTVKIEDVARQAGVSTATVSRTLSNPNLVSENTRDLVFEAIRITGYRLNRAARNLRKQQAGAVLILVRNLGNEFFSRILSGISAGFEDTDYSVLIADTLGMSDVGDVVLDYFLDSRIDGMISLDGGISQDDLDRFEQNGVADKIVFACEWVENAPYPSVRSDNGKGAKLAVQHLYELGHRNIAEILGPDDNVLTHMRHAGLVQACEELGIERRAEWTIPGAFTLEAGYSAAKQIAEMKERPTAVFCACDLMAFGLISGLREFGISVPEEMSVVGFDDIELAGYCVPPLTTIWQDRRQLGLGAVSQMLQRLKTNAEKSNRLDIDLVDVSLVERSSTAPPAKQP